jgi:squalene-hopene/tetraprenyl-beta-curcumene cyclase
MQCKNGGWASFDKDNTKMIFQYIPFADHNAMLDPPTVDITGRILEMLATYGYTRDDKRVEKAIKFIFSEQEPDGSWFGRWGVNYIYGTFLVLRGLEAMGVWNHEPQIQQAAEWIRMVQNPMAAGAKPAAATTIPTRAASARARRRRLPGRFLDCWPRATIAATRCQGRSLAAGAPKADGEWDESTGEGATRQALYTGTGFPRVFYLAYHMYRNYFPLLALTTTSGPWKRGLGLSCTEKGALVG